MNRRLFIKSTTLGIAGLPQLGRGGNASGALPQGEASGTVDWSAVRAKVAEQPWAAESAARLIEAFEEHVSRYPEYPPRGISAWSHYYFCESCAVRLDFNPGLPETHLCPDCGERYTGSPWDESWRALAHMAIRQNLERAALLARIYPENARYRDYYRKTLLFYADEYLNYELHDKHGKPMPGIRTGTEQARVNSHTLMESLFLIAVCRTLSWGEGADWLSPAEEARVASGLLEPGVDLIRPKISRIHNINCWMQGFLAAAGYRLQDRDLEDFALNSEFGWRAQLQNGVRDDGFWWEGAVGYHYFALDALMVPVELLPGRREALITEPRLRAMFHAPLELVYPTGLMPTYNDGWARQRLASYPTQYESAHGLGLGDFRALLAWCYEDAEAELSQRGRLSPSALLYGPAELPGDARWAPPRSNRALSASGLGILENDTIRLTLRSHPDCGGHDHRDKPSVEAWVAGDLWAGDLGSSGYGIPMTAGWYRSGPAHNMVVVDRERPQRASARLFVEGLDDNTLSGESTESYPGVRVKRFLRLGEKGWQDNVEVVSQEEHLYDWCFHGQGNLVADLDWSADHQPGEGHGYDWLSEVEGAPCDGAWSAIWQNETYAVRVDFEACPGTWIYRARCPGFPGDNDQGWLMVRRRATKTRFDAAFSVV